MAAPTATIRVPRDTRDKLAQQAHDRGVTLATMLSEMAREMELEAIFEAERRAVHEDAESPEALEEIAVWDTTLEDGLGSD